MTMAATPSHMIALGTLAPEFTLLNPVNGKHENLHQHQGKNGTLIIFMCNHCPYVLHIIQHLNHYAKELLLSDIRVIGINSNDVNKYPEDSPENMVIFSEDKQLAFPYLFDETQTVAKAYQAACTPDLFLFDHKLSLVYRGQYDSSRPKNDIPITGSDLKKAIYAIINHYPPIEPQTPSIGCNIKWK